MKKYLLFPIFLLCIISLTAQSFSMNQVFERPCLHDNNISIVQFNNWEIYQTENNFWDGEQLNQCHEISKSANKFYLSLENIDVSKAIFFSSLRAPNNEQTLKPDWIYTLNSGGSNSAKDFFDLDRTCGTDLCSGIILGIEMPNSDYTGVITTIHKIQFDEFFNLNACVPTEQSDNQRLNKAIIKLTIDSLENDSLMRIPSRYIDFYEEWITPNTFWEMSMASGVKLIDNYYSSNISEVVDNEYYSDWYLGLHDPFYLTTQPEDVYYIDVDFWGSNQSNLEIYLDEYQTLSLQSNVEFRGGLLNGSDSLRHNFMLTQDGANMCVSIVEFTHGSGTTFRYKSGDIYLGSQDACIKFKDGAKLIVDHTEMIYGDGNAAGMMALESGSEVHLEGKASLVFNNTLAILRSIDTDYEYIDIYLKRGQSLVFNPTAKVISFGDPLIKVHMLGGNIDLSELTEEEKSKFILVYPTPKTNLSENLEIFPNPILDNFNFSYNSLEKGTFQWTITDISGQLVQKGKKNIQKGLTDYSINNIELSAGIYFFNLKTDKGSISKKLVK